jgi:hypothetical protein
MWFTYTQKSVSESFGVKLTTDFLFPALCSDNLVHTRQDKEMQLLIENVLCGREGEALAEKVKLYSLRSKFQLVASLIVL